MAHGRTRRVWIAATLAVVTATAITALAVRGDGEAAKTVPPAAVVGTYLRDLAAGDAAGALAQGRHSGSKKLLDDAVLRRQQQLAPISAVRIGATTTAGDHAQVRAGYRFGSRQAQQTFELTRRAGTWLLDRTTFEIDSSALSRLPSPMVFDRNVSKLTSLAIFPGPITVTTHNKYLRVAQRRATSFALSPFDATATYAGLTVAPNAAGVAVLHRAASAYLDGCLAAVVLTPKHCPQEEGDPEAIDGSAHWRLQTDVASALRFLPSLDDPTTLAVQADLLWTCTYSARPNRRTVVTRTQRDITNSLGGTVDLTAALVRFKPDT